MRRWWRSAALAADEVSARPGLWLPGALSWTITVGWLPLLFVVARPPSVAELTFLGARIYTSGAWPWNVIVGSVAVLVVVGLAVLLCSLAEATLVANGRRPPGAAALVRAVGVAAVTATPAMAAVLAGATAFVVVAIDEFNAPGAGDPLPRTLVRVAPFIVVAVAAWVGGALVHAAALRSVVLDDATVREALTAGAQRLAAAGAPVVAGVLATLVARLAYLAVIAVLLHVLWRSLAPRVGASGIDAELAPLLVGFVAIWLCCVLGGGALHAWASLTWSLVLGHRRAEHDGAGRRPEGDPHRP